MRYKFIELLIRISKAKYIEADLEDKISHAFERLMKEAIIPRFVMEPWIEFREEKLWSVDVNDVFKKNMEGLRKI